MAQTVMVIKYVIIIHNAFNVMSMLCESPDDGPERYDCASTCGSTCGTRCLLRSLVTSTSSRLSPDVDIGTDDRMVVMVNTQPVFANSIVSKLAT